MFARTVVLSALLAPALLLGSLDEAIAQHAPRSDAHDEETAMTTKTAAKTIVEIAAADGSFETLVAAVKAAGLAETLSGEGPFTVFAPTDAAFGKLPDGTVDELLKAENRARLVEILTYHVVPGRVPASEAMKLSSATTASGQEIRIRTSDGRVKVNDATVVTADVEAANGVIHVIDTVLLPPQG